MFYFFLIILPLSHPFSTLCRQLEPWVLGSYYILCMCSFLLQQLKCWFQKNKEIKSRRMTWLLLSWSKNPTSLSRLMLILYTVWLSCATITKSLSSCNLQQLHLSTSKEVSSRWLYRESCSSKKMVSQIKHRAIQQPGLTKLVLPIVSMQTVKNSDLCSIQHGLHGYSQP